MHQILNGRTPRLRSVAKSVALSFLWVPAFAGMTACYAKTLSLEGRGLWFPQLDGADESGVP